MNFSVFIDRSDGVTVLPPRFFQFNRPFTTSDSIIFTIKPPNPIQNTTQPIDGSSRIDFTVVDESALLDTNYAFIITETFDDHIRLGMYYNDDGTFTTIDTVDSLYDGDTFQLNGFEGIFTFETDPPPTAATYALMTLKPVAPNILDQFQFELEGSSTDKKKVKSDLNKIRVVPNPYIVASRWEPEFGELRKEPLRQIQFINLPAECSIKIFTVAGDLINTIRHANFSGTETWDLRAEGGREVTAGIYLYVVKTDQEQYMNRFAVIK